jgi:hypothetical protein
MANEAIPSLRWSTVLTATPSARERDLPGDKILLPQSALEQLLAASPRVPVQNGHSFTAFDPSNPYSVAAAQRERSFYTETQHQLPQPLMFRLTNEKNGTIVFAGIREFSAQEDSVVLSAYLSERLGISPAEFAIANGNTAETAIDLESSEVAKHVVNDGPLIKVEAQHLQKGTYVRLRPLEAGYNPDDWKSLLERHLRENYTTLTKDSMFSVRGVKGEVFRFLADKFKPEGPGICVVDTDLEVDIEALNEEQARETLRQIVERSKRAAGTAGGSSVGGPIDIWKAVEGQVLDGDYVDYELPSWDRQRPLQITLSEIGEGDEVDLLVSPKSARQRAAPRETEHVFANFASSHDGSKSITIQPTNVELDNADSLLVSVYGRSSHRFVLRAKTVIDAFGAGPMEIESREEYSADDEQCKNCLKWIPKRTMHLHENFCLRNNVICPRCKQVFQKRSVEWEEHWHCNLGDESHSNEAYGNTRAGKSKHDGLFHTFQTCPSETCQGLSFLSIPDLARHRTSTCPGKLILCQFCHLEVPQEGDPNDPSIEAETVLSGLTPHERADGARTTDCHLCDAIVRLRDMAAHMKHHELDKERRAKPELCRDVLCGRTLHGVGPKGQVGSGTRMGQGPGNAIGLCSICFGPLYVSMHDPEGKAMRRRVERRYLSQLITGCGKRWCANEWCKTGRKNIDLDALPSGAAAALPLVKPLVVDAVDERWKPMHLCVDEGSQQRRKLAEMLAAEGRWDLEWCVAACEAEGANLDRAREWLTSWAPMRHQQKA